MIANATITVYRMSGNENTKTPSAVYTGVQVFFAPATMDIVALYDAPVGSTYQFLFEGDFNILPEDKLTITSDAGSGIGSHSLIVRGRPQRKNSYTGATIGVAVLV